MPISIPFVATTDDYPQDENPTLGVSIGPSQHIATISFTVSNASVFVQIAKLDKTGKPVWDLEETAFAPGSGGYQSKIHGIRFRSAVAGSPAVISGAVYFTDDPVPFFNNASAPGTVGPGGGFSSAGAFASYFAQESVPDGNNQTGTFSWDGLPGQTDLFDLSSPGFPTAKQSGLYCLSVCVFPNASSFSAPGKFATLNIDMQSNGSGNGFASQVFSLEPDGFNTRPYCTVTQTWRIDQGFSWDAIIGQQAGVGPIVFDYLAYIAKLA